jgi:hypothetical protein
MTLTQGARRAGLVLSLLIASAWCYGTAPDVPAPRKASRGDDWSTPRTPRSSAFAPSPALQLRAGRRFQKIDAGSAR